MHSEMEDLTSHLEEAESQVAQLGKVCQFHVIVLLNRFSLPHLQYIYQASFDAS